MQKIFEACPRSNLKNLLFIFVGFFGILQIDFAILKLSSKCFQLQILEEIGGSTATEMTRRVMSTLFTVKLCTKYTLKGKRAYKGNFGELGICKVIESK